MRVGFVRNVGLAALGLAVVALAACNDDPLGFDTDDTTGMFVNPSVMVVPAGRVSKLESRPLNQGQEPTFAEVLVNDTQLGEGETVNAGCVTVGLDPDATSLNPPGLFVVTGLNAVGSCSFTLSAGGVEEVVEVSVVADAVELTCPDVVRSAETGTIDAALLSFDGTEIGPLDQTADLEWSSDNSDAVAVDETGSWTATAAGSAEITATWSGTDATGTSGLVTRTGTCVIEVAGGTPFEASFVIDGEPVTDLGVVDQTVPVVESEFEVRVFDEAGNVNPFAAEILGITATSADPAVATVTTTREEVGEGETVELFVAVTPVGGGTTTISGTVETTAGDLPFSATVRVVGIPTIDAITPTAGLVGEVVTLDMTGLEDVHRVFIDGTEIETIFIESVTATQIVFWMPFVGIGEHEVAVGREGALSDPVTFELTSEGSADAPAYLDPGTAPATALPTKKVAYLSPDVIDHFYLVTIPAGGGTLTIDMDWNSGSDFDILMTDAAFTAFVCTNGATGAQPEQAVCPLDAGQYLLWINNYDETEGTYVFEAVFEPAAAP